MFDQPHPTEFWRVRADGRVQCTLCPRACALREGQRGFCFVRGCADGQIVLWSYGRTTGFALDPIEKKPLYHFLPGTSVLSFGTVGCNLGCRFCQNWTSSKARAMAPLAASAMPERIAAEAARHQASAVAYTYNDPAIFLEYATDTAAACRALGLRNVAVTAGYFAPRARERFFAAMDAANIDLKAFSNDFYRRLCGARLGPVLETIEYVHAETAVWLELTTLLIPGHNDSDAELSRLCDWILTRLGPEVPLHLSAFHPDHQLRQVPPTPPATLLRARRIARGHGLRHVYLGNLRLADGGDTHCTACGARLIARLGYRLHDWRLTADGRCPDCGARCAGIFSAAGLPAAPSARRGSVGVATQPVTEQQNR